MTYPETLNKYDFENRDPLKGDVGIGPRFPVFGPRWREGARGKGSKAIGQEGNEAIRH
jgi:hypothetical protein